MTSTARLITGSLLVLSALLFSCGPSSPPNVLFIAIDDLNDWVGCLDNYPGVRTPNIDRLASKGTLFTNAHCSAPGCNASRTSLITGVAPYTSGVLSNAVDWRELEVFKDIPTLPDHFRMQGYKTIGGGKIYHAYSFNKQAFMGHFDPEPWDEWFPSKEQQMPYEIQPENWPVNTSKDFYNGYFDWSPMDIRDAEMADAQVVEWAEEQLGQEHDKPLFLAVGIYRPHVPWYTPQSWFDLHPLDQVRLPETHSDDLEDIPEAGRQLLKDDWHQWLLEKKQWKPAIQGYLASMSFADAMVGRLIRALEDGPMADNTIIVLWSDHGYHLGQKEHWEKFALWDQTTHVPLIITDRIAGIGQEGQECPQPVSLLDIYPTLSEMCGFQIPSHVEGHSLVPLIRDPEQITDRPVIISHGKGMFSVRSERWDFIRYPDSTYEFYDLQNDPHEFRNLYGIPSYDSLIAEHEDYLDKQLVQSSKGEP